MVYNKGKAYEQMDDLGGFPLFLETPKWWLEEKKYPFGKAANFQVRLLLVSGKIYSHKNYTVKKEVSQASSFAAEKMMGTGRRPNAQKESFLGL